MSPKLEEGLALKRYRYSETGPSWYGIDIDFSPVPVYHNRMGDMQPETCASTDFLRGEERFEESGSTLF